MVEVVVEGQMEIVAGWFGGWVACLQQKLGQVGLRESSAAVAEWVQSSYCSHQKWALVSQV